MSRHWGRRLFITLAIVKMLPTLLLADGAFVWKAGADLMEPEQRGIIRAIQD